MMKIINNEMLKTKFPHKEKIAPLLLDTINSGNHYLAKSKAYPESLGGGNFLLNQSQSHFGKTLNRMKRIHQIDDIPPKVYSSIKNNIPKIVDNIQKIESDYPEDINSLAENIIRNTYDVPKNIQFSINGDNPNDFEGDSLVKSFNSNEDKSSLDTHDDIQRTNNKIDRQKIQHALLCGGANDSMWAYKPHEGALDDLHYKLGGLYDKFNAFNDFNIWVTPDENLSDGLETDDDSFEIYENGDGYNIHVNASNLPTILYQLSKGVLSVLFNEKYNNSFVDYNNPWNTRIGYPMWKKFKGMTKFKRNFPYIIDATSQLNDNDFNYTMREVLADTQHGRNIFETLNSRI